MARAPKTIDQRIQLNGGKEIRDELANLGKTGEAAFRKIQAAAVKADFARFRASLKGFGSDLSTVARRASIAFGALAAAAGAVAGAFSAAAVKGAEAADAAGKAAQAAGLAVDAYGRLQFAAEQSGVAQGEFDAALARLNRTIAEAASGTKAAVEAFEAVGVSFVDNQGKIRKTGDVLLDLADAFAAMPDSAEKSALALEFFSRSGAKLIPFLNSTRAGIVALGDQAERLGIVFTEQQFRIAEAMNDTLAETRRAVGGIVAQLGLLFAPLITAGAAALRDVLIENRQAIVALGEAVRGRVVEVVRDLANILAGNENQVQNRWILDARDAILQFGSAVSSVVSGVVIPLFQAIHAAAAGVASAINSAFGTEFTAAQVLVAATIGRILGLFALLSSSLAVVASAVRLLGSAFAFAFAGGTAGAASAFFASLVRGAAAFIPLIGALIGWPALIVAGVVAAGVAIVVFWDEIKAGASAAWEFVSGLFTAENFAALFQGIGAGVAAVFNGIGALIGLQVEAWKNLLAGLASALAPAFDAAGAAISLAFETIGQIVSAVIDRILATGLALVAGLAAVWQGISTAADLAFSTISTAAQFAADTVSSVFGGAVETIRSLFAGVGSFLSNLFGGTGEEIKAAAAQIVEAVQAASEIAGDIEGAERIASALAAPFQRAAETIRSAFVTIRQIVASGLANVLAAVQSAASALDAAINRILAALRRALAQAQALKAAAASSSSGSGGSAPQFAGGGQVKGPGTGTSDSILAWLSNGEFVQRTAAVRYYGADFMRALNELRIPRAAIARLLRGLSGFSGGGPVQTKFALPAFNLGGMVDAVRQSFVIPSPIPAFADGGPVASKPGGRPLTLVLDGQSFPVLAPEPVAAELEKYMLRASIRQISKKPGYQK